MVLPVYSKLRVEYGTVKLDLCDNFPMRANSWLHIVVYFCFRLNQTCELQDINFVSWFLK